MLRLMLKSKIHRATVTEADLNYEGSLTLDEDLMDAAGLKPFEGIQVYNITNGSRLETYVITGERGSGTICINGAAAHLTGPGDLVIIASYTWLALAVFIFAGQVDFVLGLVLAAGNSIGAYVAARLAVRKGATWVRWVLIVAALGAAIRMATS